MLIVEGAAILKIAAHDVREQCAEFDQNKRVTVSRQALLDMAYLLDNAGDLVDSLVLALETKQDVFNVWDTLDKRP